MECPSESSRRACAESPLPPGTAGATALVWHGGSPSGSLRTSKLPHPMFPAASTACWIPSDNSDDLPQLLRRRRAESGAIFRLASGRRRRRAAAYPGACCISSTPQDSRLCPGLDWFGCRGLTSRVPRLRDWDAHQRRQLRCRAPYLSCSGGQRGAPPDLLVGIQGCGGRENVAGLPLKGSGRSLLHKLRAERDDAPTCCPLSTSH
jgi:hypothetical protein